MMRRLITATISAAALCSLSALAQERRQDTAPIPDFSGVWGNPYLYGIEPPQSGPGPVVNKMRQRQLRDVDGRPLPPANAPLVSEARQLVGDYSNPILNPEAAEIVKKHGEMALSGVGYPSPRNQCWPQGAPFIFTNDAVQLLQQPGTITMLYDEDHEVRRVRMNQAHPAQVAPSWYGDSVGRYEGDTLVIDTIGFKIGPFSAVDQYGTPFSHDLHLVERYRLIDYEDARKAWERGGKENVRGGAVGETWAPDPNYKGKALQLASSRLRTKASSQPFGPRPKPIGECSATGLKTFVLKTRINTALRKTLRSRSLISPTSESWGLLAASPLSPAQVTEIDAASALRAGRRGYLVTHVVGFSSDFLARISASSSGSSEKRQYHPFATVVLDLQFPSSDRSDLPTFRKRNPALLVQASASSLKGERCTKH